MHRIRLQRRPKTLRNNDPGDLISIACENVQFAFLSDADGFLKSNFKGPKCNKSSFSRKKQMWWRGRGNCGGSWLPEEKKRICGPEEEIVVAHGRLLSFAHTTCISDLF